jgi:putative aldouronate transport system permease protein
MTRDRTFSEKLFAAANTGIMILFSLVCLLPFVNILVSSFASPETITMHPFLIIPREINLSGYKYIFSARTLLRSIRLSGFIAIAGTFINIFLTALTAYPLSRRQLKGKNIIQFCIVFTMLFSGGMIPTFLVVRATGLFNSVWALMIPSAISAFNLVIMKNFLDQIPVELEESAKIDGCNDFIIWLRIILPVSTAVLATLTLFYGVSNWNSYFNAVIYINASDKWTVQIVLRQVVAMAMGGIGDMSQLDPDFVVPSKTVQMGTIVVATLPIVLIYPFAQKYFVKGALLGSVKG